MRSPELKKACEELITLEDTIRAELNNRDRGTLNASELLVNLTNYFNGRQKFDRAEEIEEFIDNLLCVRTVNLSSIEFGAFFKTLPEGITRPFVGYFSEMMQGFDKLIVAVMTHFESELNAHHRETLANFRQMVANHEKWKAERLASNEQAAA